MGYVVGMSSKLFRRHRAVVWSGFLRPYYAEPRCNATNCHSLAEGVPARFVALTLDGDTLGAFSNSHLSHGRVYISQMFPSSLT